MTKQQMSIVIVGHVDHGKSTLIGRLLADTDSLPKGKLDQIKQFCELNSKPFEYAFLLDALKDERSQGITIDSARVFFKTKKRNYIIIDAPGHIEFLKNMVSGASRAEAAILVIDALEGIQENSRRHGYMLSMLGINQLLIAINKMDLINYDQITFNQIVKDYSSFLKDINLEPKYFIPISGTYGDNMVKLSKNLEWYNGPTLLTALDEFDKEKPDYNKPFRMPVQDVYKFTKMGDQRRIIAGTVESGTLKIGDTIVFYPSGKKSIVKSFETFNSTPPNKVSVGESVGFTLGEQIYITRGEIATKAEENKPLVSKRLRVNLFWLGKKPLIKEKEYLLKLGTSKVGVFLEEIIHVINASDLSIGMPNSQINRHDVAECIIQLNKAISFDRTEEIASTSRFVIVDEYEIAGGGIIREALEDNLTWMREKVIQRNIKWEKSHISVDQRAEKYNQKSALIIITGPKNSGKKEVAKELEEVLFRNGKFVYFISTGNILYGVDADIKSKNGNREEHIRRISEVANILLDTGLILIITAINLNMNDLDLIKTSLDNPDKTEIIWVGDEVYTDIDYEIKIPGIINVQESVTKIYKLLLDKGIILNPF
ncbi:MAG TPA: GTP-binding protein [Melioribacteraceae bacterium]|nr:GTP-binding protein [Melioribacteraceae bacterium]